MATPFTLVPNHDAEVMPAPLADADAKRLDDRIRRMATATGEHAAKLADLIAEAKRGQVHRALGFTSWPAYLADRLAPLSAALTGDVRREVVALMAGQGMSQRAIAAVTGASQSTVSRHLSGDSSESPDDADAGDGVPEPSPATVTGLDGKTYAKRRADPAVQPLNETFMRRWNASREAVVKLCKIADSDRFDPASLGEDADAIRSQIEAAISALNHVRARLEAHGVGEVTLTLPVPTAPPG